MPPTPHNFSNARHQSLKLENFKIGTPYAITISPPDLRDISTEQSNSVRTLSDFGLKYQTKKKWLLKLHSCIMELYPELSPTGILHWHGTVIIADIFKFMWHDLKILEHAAYKIDDLNDPDKWFIYCTKQTHIMRDACHAINENYPLITTPPPPVLDPLAANIMRYTD